MFVFHTPRCTLLHALHYTWNIYLLKPRVRDIGTSSNIWRKFRRFSLRQICTIYVSPARPSSPSVRNPLDGEMRQPAAVHRFILFDLCITGFAKWLMRKKKKQVKRRVTLIVFASRLIWQQNYHPVTSYSGNVIPMAHMMASCRISPSKR